MGRVGQLDISESHRRGNEEVAVELEYSVRGHADTCPLEISPVHQQHSCHLMD